MTQFADTPTRPRLSTNGKKRVQQHHRDDADINVIVDRWRKTGRLPMPTKDELYADLTDVDDYLTSKLKIEYALESFKRLPIKLQKRFDHEPGELLRFLDNPDNRTEAIDLGLIEKDEPVPDSPTPSGEGDEPPAGDPVT